MLTLVFRAKCGTHLARYGNGASLLARTRWLQVLVWRVNAIHRCGRGGGAREHMLWARGQGSS